MKHYTPVIVIFIACAQILGCAHQPHMLRLYGILPPNSEGSSNTLWVSDRSEGFSCSSKISYLGASLQTTRKNEVNAPGIFLHAATNFPVRLAPQPEERGASASPLNFFYAGSVNLSIRKAERLVIEIHRTPTQNKVPLLYDFLFLYEPDETECLVESSA